MQLSQILITVKTRMARKGTLDDKARALLNAAIKKSLTSETRQREAAIARRQAWYKCSLVGHVWHIASGYQTLHDNGVDVPVECGRCGEWDM